MLDSEGPLQECEEDDSEEVKVVYNDQVISVDARRSFTAVDVVKLACSQAHIRAPELYYLVEVLTSQGHVCQERQVSPGANPIQMQRLWPLPQTLQDGSIDRARCFFMRSDSFEIGSTRGSWLESPIAVQSSMEAVLSAFAAPVSKPDCPDLCSLPELNERTIMGNLEARFEKKRIYTYVGSILIAVNPFTFFPIYNPKYVKLYQNKKLGELPPHIFAVADAAFHAMLHYHKDQCIVISGESGSGKTESTHLLLHHLTALSKSGSNGRGLENIVLGSGPVLEAFGNAKTIHNNNSSRFGKFIQVNYRENGVVQGAVIEQYLLEKSRIVHQQREERNYHVFYYLMAGLNEKEKTRLHLTQPEDFRYLSQSDCYSLEGVDEKGEFSRLQQSMDVVGFPSDVQKRVFSILAAVLHIGNIRFTKKQDYYHGEAVKIEKAGTTGVVSTLLQVSETALAEVLTTKRTLAGGEMVIMNYRMEEAVATRDSMAKHLYGVLFEWIVLQVNSVLAANHSHLNPDRDTGKSIGVLDIFGFEDIMGQNSFEQLCINYANEHLQYYFNQHIFKLEQEEYKREGIQWRNIDFIDNTGCVELFCRRGNGIFLMLDEQSNFPGATNDSLLTKLHAEHRSSPSFEVPQVKENSFTVVHYAGKVKYNIKDFREKNSDVLRNEIRALLKNSGLPFVRELIAMEHPVAYLRWSIVRAFFQALMAFKAAGRRAAKGGPRGGSLKRGVESNRPSAKSPGRSSWSLSAADFQELKPKAMARFPDGRGKVSAMVEMYRKKPRRLSKGAKDVHAMKWVTGRTRPTQRPGAKKQSSSVSAQFQVSLTKLMETLNRATPYFVRCIKSNAEKAAFKFDEDIILRQLRYTGMLATVEIRQSGYNYRYTFADFALQYWMLLRGGHNKPKEEVLLFMEKHKTLFGQDCQIGRIKLFFRERVKLECDWMLHQKILQYIKAMQNRVRGKLQRVSFLRTRSAAELLQNVSRMRRCRACFLEQASAVHLLQRNIRRYLVRRRWQETGRRVAIVQAVVRGFLARRKILRLRSQATLERSAGDETDALVIREEGESREPAPRLSVGTDVLETQFPVGPSDGVFEEPGSDEGILRGSSAEELPGASSRVIGDSEGSSGILEDADAYDNSLYASLAQTATISAAADALQDIEPPSQPSEEKLEAESEPENETETERKSPSPEKEPEVLVTPPVVVEPPSEDLWKLDDLEKIGSDLEGSQGDLEGSKDDVEEPAEEENETGPITVEALCPEADEELRDRQGSKARVGAAILRFSDEREDEAGIEGVVVKRALTKSLSEEKLLGPPRRIPAPLATQESTSDEALDTSADLTQDGRGKNIRATPLSPVERKNLEDALRARNLPSGGSPSELTHHHKHGPGHSPFHRKFKIFGRGPKKSAGDESGGDSEGEGDQSANTPNVSLALAKVVKTTAGEAVGVPVLPPTREVAPSSPAEEPPTWAGIVSGGRRSSAVDKPGGLNTDTHTKKRRPSRKHAAPLRDNAPHDKNKPEEQTKAWRVADTSQWRMPTHILVAGLDDLPAFELFWVKKLGVLTKQSEWDMSGTDRMFKSAVMEWYGQVLQQVATNSNQKGKKKGALRYNDLMEIFKSILEQQFTIYDVDEGSVTLVINAFRGYLDEFTNKRPHLKKDDYKHFTVKKKKKNKYHLEDNGHQFESVSFSIPSFCESCNSRLWFERGLVCATCKYTCHKRCYQKNPFKCPGTPMPKVKDKDREKKGSVSNQSRVFGAPLSSLVTEDTPVPPTLEAILSAIEMLGLYQEGIYRKSGVASQVDAFVAASEADPENPPTGDYSVNVLTNSVKRFLKEMPEPLLTWELYPEVLQAVEYTQHKDRVRALFSVCEQLPSANFAVFERLLYHLARVSLNERFNRMNPSSLATIFVPSVLRPPRAAKAQDELVSIAERSKALEILISEQTQKLRARLADIDLLSKKQEAVVKRLETVRLSMRQSQRPHVAVRKRSQQDDDDDADDDDDIVVGGEELKATSPEEEEKILKNELASVTRKKMTNIRTMNTLERPLSDDDMLSNEDELSDDQELARAESTSSLSSSVSGASGLMMSASASSLAPSTPAGSWSYKHPPSASDLARWRSESDASQVVTRQHSSPPATSHQHHPGDPSQSPSKPLRHSVDSQLGALREDDLVNTTSAGRQREIPSAFSGERRRGSEEKGRAQVAKDQKLTVTKHKEIFI